MKLLTLNFLTCAIKTCKTNPASFPLHPRDAELEIVETDVNLAFLKNILPRILWDELRGICSEVRETKILPERTWNAQKHHQDATSLQRLSHNREPKD
jgi:multifunctional methyltransferase subunit TRM112